MKYATTLAFARAMRKNQTPAEKLFWSKVRNRKLFGKKINRQFIIEHGTVQGQKKFFIVDFYCHEKRLIIEVDGGIHQEQIEYDQWREDILREMGHQIIRFQNEEVLYAWEAVEARLKEVLGSGTHPGLRPPLSCKRGES